MTTLSFRRILVASVCALHSSTISALYVPVETAYCIKYFGELDASIDLASDIPKTSFDGTNTCPRSWTFPTVSGATLVLCPPFGSGADWAGVANDNDGSALWASLTFHFTGSFGSKPVDHLRFENALITNGSFQGPFKNDGKPAVLSVDEDRVGVVGPMARWRIDGTQDALVEDPKEKGGFGNGIYFTCNALPSRSAFEYCGNSNDLDFGGCWREDFWRWSMQSPLNFSVRFSNFDATVEMSAQDEYKVNGTGTGSFHKGTISFSGDRKLPSVTNYDFWENSGLEYEIEASKINQMTFQEDGTGFPIIINNTETKEWYATRNRTFSASIAPRVHNSAASFTLFVGIVVSFYNWI